MPALVVVGITVLLGIVLLRPSNADGLLGAWPEPADRGSADPPLTRPADPAGPVATGPPSATVTPVPPSESAAFSPPGTRQAAPGEDVLTPSVPPTQHPATTGPPGSTQRPSTQPTPVRPAGAIGAPAEGTQVRQCAYFSGTSRLPAGKTLILAVRNLSSEKPNKYVTYVFGWDKPSTLSSWRGRQYFGDGDSSVGQKYRVELMVVDLAAARAATAEAKKTTPADYTPVHALASRGTALAARTVVRIAGSGPNNNCAA